MPRPLRPQVPGGIYHVVSKGNRGEAIYVDAESRRYQLGLFALTAERYEWFCPAYCQMGNHFHLLLRTPKPNISAGMQYFNARYAEWFNWRNGHRGHLFQGRFWSQLVESDEHLLEAARYIVLNPVRAGLRRDPIDWAWSSYAATIGLAARPEFVDRDWLLSLFAADPIAARLAYRRFVSEGARALRTDTAGV